MVLSRTELGGGRTPTCFDARFPRATQADCYRWLGKTLAVLTDGEFGRSGCAQLAPPARGHCAAGARTIDEALVTFS